MISLAQGHSQYPGHPGVTGGHPMAGMPQHPGQQMPGQPGMAPQMHMGVSGPGGPQVSQAGAMMGMQPGAGVPSAHALQHLNPAAAQQAQMYQQQMAFNPQMQHQMHQQQQMIHQQQQAAARRQAMMAQQYGGMNAGAMGMPNGMNPMTPAQAATYANMRAGNPAVARPVNLPSHLQQAQAQAQAQAHQQAHQQQQQSMEQQQHQAQLMQQLAMQQGVNNPAQMNPQQMQNMQIAQQQQAHHQAQAAQAAQAQAAAAAQHNQAQQSQAQQPPQPQSAPQAQQAGGPQLQQQVQQQQQQQAAAAAAMMQQQQARQGAKPKNEGLLKLLNFADQLSGFGGAKAKDDLDYWKSFAHQFFSQTGVLRHTLLVVDEAPSTHKQYEITFPALPRYYHTHFESGIKSMQMIVERATESDMPGGFSFVHSAKTSFIQWFDNGAQLISSGSLKVHFDPDQKMELFEFITVTHDEYLPRNKVIDSARPLHEWGKEWKLLNSLPEGKQSPEMNKKKPKPMKSPQQPPPDIDLPQTKIKPSMGITPAVFRFLELVEVMGHMNPLFDFAHANTSLAPYKALDQYVANFSQNGANAAQQKTLSGPRTPGLSNFTLGQSPAAAHLQLPDGSPHMGSPAQGQAMQLQQSQHGTSSSGPSANTSPNASNKRRRPSTVKTEEDNQANGATKPGVRPSPRIPKRQKGNPS